MNRRIVDFHTHAFPDDLAGRAMRVLLEETPGIKAYRDGTVGDLLRSMDEAGIETSVVCCIATKPGQFEPILRWCDQIRSKRLVPFPSIHPADPHCIPHVRKIRAEGFKGIKMHPFYQDFFVSDENLSALYEQAAQDDLILVMHTGYDIAFPRIDRANPKALWAIQETVPDLKLVTTHLGAWQQWDEVEQYLLGREVRMEISFAMEDVGLKRARHMIMHHPDHCIFFGSDSPWTDQSQTLALLEELRLPAEKLQRILTDNARDLLELP